MGPHRASAFSAAAVVSSPLPCFGQAGKAELFGTIQDPQGLAVAQAKVTGEEQATGARFDVTTDDRGDYHLLGLAAGRYVLTVEKPGFRPYRQTGITLRIGDQIRLDVKLELGQASQSVDVNAEASLLETANGSVSYHVSQPQIETLPLDGRNFIPLVALSPGVALPGGGSLLPRINGSRPRTNEYLYDGISVLQPEPGQVAFYPIIDAMEEFRLNINAYSPEYGRSNGGTVMVIGKSGSNQFHGTLFEFLRNEDLNARNYFAPAGSEAGIPQKSVRSDRGRADPQEQDVFLCRLARHPAADRNHAPKRCAHPGSTQRRVHHHDLRSGNLASRCLSRTIRSRRTASIRLRYRCCSTIRCPMLPAPTTSYCTGVEPDNQDQFDGRIDHVFNEKHRAFVRYSYLRDNDTPVPFLPDGSGNLTSGVIGHAITRGDGIASEYDWTFRRQR